MPPMSQLAQDLMGMFATDPDDPGSARQSREVQDSEPTINEGSQSDAPESKATTGTNATNTTTSTIRAAIIRGPFDSVGTTTRAGVTSDVANGTTVANNANTSNANSTIVKITIENTAVPSEADASIARICTLVATNATGTANTGKKGSLDEEIEDSEGVQEHLPALSGPSTG
ncbi:hypothetical protein UCREL1_5898 [Eutypa lata UCREL1]|uniref:Uncharacterized protein n=1 Tax=Eutypa lata (strain UCR-EL1) TaxID=1287681 RepID=M7TKA2_EUTLA|nr:hypothetical protein UCREL1_5898 [Eutypa lata UCREL1]